MPKADFPLYNSIFLYISAAFSNLDASGGIAQELSLVA